MAPYRPAGVAWFANSSLQMPSATEHPASVRTPGSVALSPNVLLLNCPLDGEAYARRQAHDVPAVGIRGSVRIRDRLQLPRDRQVAVRGGPRAQEGGPRLFTDPIFNEGPHHRIRGSRARSGASYAEVVCLNFENHLFDRRTRSAISPRTTQFATVPRRNAVSDDIE